nr:hypothetical protein [Tanacetum cinerariifolium]
MSIYDFMTLLSWSEAKIVEESHHLSLLLLERVPSHATAQAIEGAIILLLTPDEIAASLSDSHLIKKSKGPYQVSLPSKKRKLLKKALEAGSSALELDQAEGANEADLADLSVVSAFEPSHVGTLPHASTSSRSLSLRGVVTSGRIRKFEVEVMRRQMDLLDCLACSALACDAEYDQIPDDDFGIATRGKKIDLTLFPLAPGPYRMTYPYEGVSYPLYTKEGLFCLEVTSLDDKLERLQGDCDSLAQENRELCSQRDATFEDVKKLQSQLTDAKATFAVLTEELTRIDAKLSKQALTEVNEFVGSGVGGVVQKLLSSDEFHAALARVLSLGVNYGVERELHIGHTNVEFEAVVQGTLSDVAQILPKKFVRSATSDLCSLYGVSSSDVAIHQRAFMGGEDFVLSSFHWRTYVFLSFAHVVAYYFIRRFIQSASLFSLSDPWIVLLVGMPISSCMPASVPYARLNGVSLLLVLGVVLSFHSSICLRMCTDVETSFIPSPYAQDLNGSLIRCVLLFVMMMADLLGPSCTPHDPMCISFIRYLVGCGPMHRSNGPRMRHTPDPCSLDAPSVYNFHMSYLVLRFSGLSFAITSARKSASTCPFIKLLGAYLMS